MKHLLLIEHAAHFEVARAYALMFLDGGWRVTLALNEKNQGYLNHILEKKEHVRQLVLKEGSDESLYGIDVDKAASEADLIIVCSHENKKGELIHNRWKTPCYLVIHDGYNYLDPYRHLVWKGGLRQWLRIVKYLASAYFQKRIHSARKYDGWLTPVEWPGEWIKKDSMPKVLYLPFLWNEGLESVKHEYYHLVVPGTINQRSRDYRLVKRLMLYLKSSSEMPRCRITLLGKAATDLEKQLVNEMMLLTSPALELITFDHHLSGPDFDAIILSADLLFLPLQPSWQYGVVGEHGGVSCLSGNIGDMVRYGKFALIPKTYKIHPLLQKHTIVFDAHDDTDVWNAFKKAINNPISANYVDWNQFVSEINNF